MAKPSVFIALYIHDLFIHYTLKYQLLLITWKLLLQAFDFVCAIMLSCIDAFWQLSHHPSTWSLPTVGWGRE